MLELRKITARLDVASSTFFASVAISKTIAEIGWQVATIRFILDPLSPLRGRNIEFGRVLGNGSIGSIRTPGPRALPCPFTQCFSRHTDKETQIPRENLLDAYFRVDNEAHILTHSRVCRRVYVHAHVCVRTCVRARRLAATPWNQLRNHGVPLPWQPPRPPPASAGSIINL